MSSFIFLNFSIIVWIESIQSNEVKLVSDGAESRLCLTKQAHTRRHSSALSAALGLQHQRSRFCSSSRAHRDEVTGNTEAVPSPTGLPFHSGLAP